VSVGSAQASAQVDLPDFAPVGGDDDCRPARYRPYVVDDDVGQAVHDDQVPNGRAYSHSRCILKNSGEPGSASMTPSIRVR